MIRTTLQAAGVGLLRNSRKTERGAKRFLTTTVGRAAPFALLGNSRKTERGTKRFLTRLAVCAAPFALLVCFAWNAPAQDADPLLRAMKDELERSRQLHLASLDAPYFIEYRVEDTVGHSIAASLGALIASDESAYRIPTVKVRVGNYSFDNTNHVYSDAYTRWPLRFGEPVA